MAKGLMPRKNLIRTNLFPYHVTIRSNNKEWFELPREVVWKICLRAMALAHQKHPVRVQAFVLMSNHYHLLIWTPENNLDRFMSVFNYQISRGIRGKTGRINRIFGDRYKWSLVESSAYYHRVLKYIYQNPLRANLVGRCEMYPYSSLNYVVTGREFPVTLYRPFFDSEREEEGAWHLLDFLSWINKEDAQMLKIKAGLKRPIFNIRE